MKKYLKYWFLAVLAGAAFFVWSAVFFESRDGLVVAFLDVGQGDAIFIESPNGNQILLDAGPGRGILKELSQQMPFYDRSLDLIILSHPDSDHIGGFVPVLDNFRVALAMEPGVESDSAVYQALEKALEEKEIKRILARRGMRLNLDQGVYLDILFPDRDPTDWDTNDASIVAKLIYGENSFLLTGDSPQKIENYLVSLEGNPPARFAGATARRAGGLKSDVLKAGHHGSKTSSAEAFLETASPYYAVISAGKDNRYGHPHKEVLDNLSALGTEVLRTDERGTIKIRSDGLNLQIRK